MTLRALIYGSCVSRDTIEHMPDAVAASYIARQSLISAATAPATFPDGVVFPSSFQERMVRDDFHSTALTTIRDTRDVDVVILDLVDERLGVAAVNGGWVTRSQEYREHVRPHVIEGTVLGLGDDAHFEAWRAATANLTHAIHLAGLADRALVIEAPFARIDERGGSAPWFERTSPAAWDARYARYYDVLRGAGLRVHTIESPVTALGHRWGPAAYHYTTSAYSAAADAIWRVASRP